jgi:hypothetical protein
MYTVSLLLLHPAKLQPGQCSGFGPILDRDPDPTYQHRLDRIRILPSTGYVLIYFAKELVARDRIDLY